VTYPTWLSATLFIASAVLAFIGTQTSVRFDGIVAVVIGAIQVAVAAALAFQKATTNTVRRMQGRPTVAQE